MTLCGFLSTCWAGDSGAELAQLLGESPSQCLTGEDLELAKLIWFEKLSSAQQEAIEQYTQGSGGLTRDLMRLENQLGKGFYKSFELDDAAFNLKLEALEKADRRTMLWVRNLSKANTFPVGGMNLHHGVSPTSIDPFQNLVRTRGSKFWPWFTSTTTDPAKAYSHASGNAQKIYTLRPTAGLTAIAVPLDLNRKGDEYEMILLGRWYSGAKENGVEVYTGTRDCMQTRPAPPPPAGSVGAMRTPPDVLKSYYAYRAHNLLEAPFNKVKNNLGLIGSGAGVVIDGLNGYSVAANNNDDIGFWEAAGEGALVGYSSLSFVGLSNMQRQYYENRKPENHMTEIPPHHLRGDKLYYNQQGRVFRRANGGYEPLYTDGSDQWYRPDIWISNWLRSYTPGCVTYDPRFGIRGLWDPSLPVPPDHF